jgi:hypothetical protein
MSTSLQSERLELVSMDATVLQALLDGNFHNAAHIGGFLIPADNLLNAAPLSVRVEQLRRRSEPLALALRAWSCGSLRPCADVSAFTPGLAPPICHGGGRTVSSFGYEFDPVSRLGFAKARSGTQEKGHHAAWSEVFRSLVSPSNDLRWRWRIQWVSWSADHS